MRFPHPRTDLMGIIIASVSLGLAVGIIGGLFFMEIPPGNREAAMLALGIVLGWGGSVVNWRFGSSHGSDEKTKMLADRPTGQVSDPVHVEAE